MSSSSRNPVPPCPTGCQWVIGHGKQLVTVTEVGATLRSYSFDGHPVIEGFDPEEWSHGGRGQVLAPWPNRLADGRYDFDGSTGQAALDEPELGNAIHGLVRWLRWEASIPAQNVASLSCTLFPSPSYPFALKLNVEYRLGRDGLCVSTVATNIGGRLLPFGLGFHPYLTIGTTSVDSAVLRLPGTARLVVDERSIPTGDVRPVAGTEFDFTAGRTIGRTRLDTAYTGLVRDSAGKSWATLTDPRDDRSVGIWADGSFDYLMCFTGDSLGEAQRRRRGVALEPMTCPPNAFRSGVDLVTLQPGESWDSKWGIRPDSGKVTDST